MMKRLLTLAIAILAASVSAQTVSVTSTKLADSSGSLFTGLVFFQPTLSNGIPTSYRQGAGGTVTSAIVPVSVTNGVFSITLPDTTLTYPANICFKLTGPNLGNGYACLQPHTTAVTAYDWCQAGVCDLDNYLGNPSPLPSIAAVQAINGIAGQVTFAGSGVSQSGQTFTFSGGSPMTYPGAGIPNSTGTAWGTSYGTANLIPANVIAALPYDASGAAAAALASAETYASNAANLTSGTVAVARLPTSIPNANLLYPATTVNGQTCTLGSTCTIPASGATLPYPGIVYGTSASGGTVATSSQVLGSFSTNVVYASKVTGATGGQAVIPGSSATGDTDSWTALNTITSAGNVDLEVDSGFALSAALNLGSNTTIHCIAPQYGFIMMAAANAPVMQNVHLNAPTTTSGTGGYLVSNQADSNIRVSGCVRNANSTQAVTGNANGHPTAHTTNPTTGYWMMGTQFVGVNGLTIDHDIDYDSGTFIGLYANDSHVLLDSNQFLEPTPIVAFKNTDGPHFVGPDQYITETNNVILSGDDSIALNADDGNITSTYTGMFPTFLKNGPITDVSIDGTKINGGYYGLRLFTGTSLEDRIQISNTSGLLCGNTAELTANTPVGPGNLGKIRISGWQVQTTGTCNNYGITYNFQIAGNAQDIQITGAQISNPAVNWPFLTQTAGTIGILSLRDSDFYTTTSLFSNVVSLTGGTVANFSVSGTNWDDSGSDTASFLSGSVVPTTVNCSNYNGPNRLLASGFTPTVENGDCFTNTYPTTYTLGHIVSPLAADGSAQQILIVAAPFAYSGTLSSISLQYLSTPPTTPLTIVIFNGTLPSLTVASSFTVTPAATTSLQTFTGGGVNFPTTTVTAGQYIGYWNASAISPGSSSTSSAIVGCYYLSGQSTLPSGATTYTNCGGGPKTDLALTATY